jgi:ATP adenylyltransferase/5',5'''-P-1,P-4-tetraphosphate phosphorylase II
MEIAFEIENLFENQFNTWNQVRVNYEDLSKVRLRTIHFEGFDIIIQYNPKRILSSGAKVDQKSISERPCFLCDKNRPPEQEGITYGSGYNLLVNPYPVFERHLTVPAFEHIPQEISGHFKTMLSLARDLPQYIIIYNGPQCGASAPDHFHFQSVKTNLMPVQHDFLNGSIHVYHGSINAVDVYSWKNYMRNPVTLKGNDFTAIIKMFEKLYKLMDKHLKSEGEPMLNILAYFSNENWVIHLFPRSLHRPSQFFEKGERQILTSPGSIDLSGFFVMAREEDFLKVTPEDIADVYRQVCVDEEVTRFLINNLN